MRTKRKQRNGESVCTCPAYLFPHRFLGGYCDGRAFVAAYLDANMFGECRACHYLIHGEDEDGRGRVTCQVLDQLEPYLKCPGLIEWVRFNGIKLYNKSPQGNHKSRGFK